MTTEKKAEEGAQPEKRHNRFSAEEIREAHRNPDPEFLEHDRQMDRDAAWLFPIAMADLFKDDVPPGEEPEPEWNQ
ncbi:MAG: hypothetical protein WCJ29_05910 [bacterium]